MRVHKLILKTKAEGPGTRACLWVQGCSHRCEGCFSKHLWNGASGMEMTTDEIIEQLQEIIEEIDGITFLGGEPLEQAQELWKVARFVKESNKNVITFTGYVYEELKSMDIAGVSELLQYTDVLADGPFIEELLNYDIPMLGSSNQRFIFLSDGIDRESIKKYRNTLEIRMDYNGRIQINGMGNLKKLKKYCNGGGYEITNI